MNKNTLITLSIVCAIVLIASAFILNRKPASNAVVETFGLTSVHVADVVKLARKDTTGSVEAVQGVGGWTVDGVAVSTSSIESFLTSLPNAHATLVAKNGRDVAAYGLTRGTQISIVSKNSTLTLDVGAAGPFEGSIYVAPPDDKQVYLLEGTLMFDTIAHADWRSWKVSTSTPPVAAPTAVKPLAPTVPLKK
jgi:hypothetical protein